MTNKLQATLILRGFLLATPEMTGVELEVQNRKLTTTPNQIWCRETFQHGSTQVYDGVCERVEAIYHLDFFSPIGTGTEAADAIISKVKERFKPRSIGDGTNRLTVFRNEELTSLTGKSTTMSPLLIYFRYFTTIQ